MLPDPPEMLEGPLPIPDTEVQKREDDSFRELLKDTFDGNYSKP